MANSSINAALLGSAHTEECIQGDLEFLQKINQMARRSKTALYAGGAHGSQGTMPLSAYNTTISAYGQRKASVRVTEVRCTGRFTY